MSQGGIDGGGRDAFASQFGLTMAAVGSAVGLGNIWRFSYILGINGGGAFLVIYILCVLLVGLPILISELSIGRHSGLSAVSAFRKLAPGTAWWLTGAVGVLAATVIAFYYPVVAGWSLGYVFESLFNWGAVAGDTGAAFDAFTSGWKSFLFAGIALCVTAVILLGGISAGIEKWSKLLMPLLGGILIILVLRSVTLPNAMAGVRFLFEPDFSSLGVGGVLDALGHSFYSLSLGMGIMITYASYMKKNADLVQAAVSILALDTGIAVLAGLAIFPAVFALGLDPGQGAGLAFVTLPGAFAQMPAGWLFSALFFLLLFIAALTSMMSILQVPLAFLEDELHLPKKKGIWIICAAVVFFGTPSALAFGPLRDFTILGLDYFTFLDRLANNILLPVTGLLGALFIFFGFGASASKREFLLGAKNQHSFIARLYPAAIKFIVPVAIVLILLNATGLLRTA
ncbi:MAG: sodium-dependent transporter [Clostridiales Family XIII bacterium]|jgi:NSS family neurotransmitter:Na+ symporter|nr:sodium-dependent transporter [Clostridiales Family XIII bacterium]